MGSPDPSKTRNFTWRELSTQNKLENAHVAHSGKVYDVSSFVSAHPGGIDQIMLGAGHDITHLFNSYHKPQTIKILEKYYVGDLIDNEMPVYAIDKPQFYRVVKKRVMDKFKSLHIDSKSDYKMFSVYIFFFVFWWALWYGSIRWHESWLIVIPCSLALGWCSSLVIFLIGHDLSHFAITHNPWVWRVGRFIVSVMSGLSIYCWTYQHTYGHHNYTNVDGVDPDTRTNDIDIWRIKDRQTWIRRYRLQCIYMPILYCFLAIKMKLQDFPTMISLQKSTIRMNPPRFYQYVEFFVAKLLHFILLLFIPMMIMPPTSLTVYYMAYEMIYGFILTLVTVLSHVSTDLAEIQPEDTRDKNWAEQQVLSTKDYATDSWIWTLLTGANNHQVAHHLFPDVLQCHYPLITPIANILKTSLEHMKYLFKMGQDPSHEKTQ